MGRLNLFDQGAYFFNTFPVNPKISEANAGGRPDVSNPTVLVMKEFNVVDVTQDTACEFDAHIIARPINYVCMIQRH